MPVKHSARRRAPAAERDVRREAGRDGDTEQRILDAANEVLLRRGTAATRMQDIAKEAGVNQALLHYYFRSKDRLAEAVFRRAAVKLLPPVVQVLASDLPLEEKVTRVVHLELDQLARTPHLPGYILCELNHDPDRAGQLLEAMTGLRVDGIAPRVFDVVGRQIKERVREKTMRPIAPEDFVINLLALCVFPFAARPMVCALLQWGPAEWTRFVARRKAELPTVFLAALRP
jgi:TetR/AcrR family transcriptional regulator